MTNVQVANFRRWRVMIFWRRFMANKTMAEIIKARMALREKVRMRPMRLKAKSKDKSFCSFLSTCK